LISIGDPTFFLLYFLVGAKEVVAMPNKRFVCFVELQNRNEPLCGSEIAELPLSSGETVVLPNVCGVAVASAFPVAQLFL
jgi:hypothetical protein